ncbi:hypothetical protein HOJ01_00530 [bacterium]|jgi:hypothetical protein|nr:hypothetical protein [bacterium]MBT6293274.1 hypothetical protein [bacterium]
MKKIKNLLLLTSLVFLLSIQAISFASNPSGRTPSPQRSAPESSTQETSADSFNRENQQSYQELRNSLIPKQKEFIQKSKNLDIDSNTKISESEQKQIQFTEGNLETQILPRILKILIYSSILIFTGLFIYAGVILIISNGDEASYTEVKNLILNTLIGVGVILGSYAIIYGLVTILQNLRP